MGVHTKRATNAEQVDRLHGFDREAVSIEELLKLSPANAVLNCDSLLFLVQSDLVQVPEVEDQATVSESLAAHTVLFSGARDFQIVLTGEPQCIADLFFVGGLNDPIDCRAIQMACVVGESSTLAKRQRRRVWRFHQ